MPIIDLQRRVNEVGRIRMGTSERRRGKKIPRRLETWRITTRDRARLEYASEAYGGEVVPWSEREGEWELITATDTLPIVLVPGQSLSQFWELWGQAGPQQPLHCMRRCDGVTELLSGQPCSCPPYDERRELATDGKACKPMTRLSVILPDVPGIGMFRLETGGYYAAVELAGTAQLLEDASARGVMLPARLRIDLRRGVRVKADGSGETVAYPVPVIDVDVRVGDIFQIGVGGGGAIEPSPVRRAALPRGEMHDDVALTYTPIPEGSRDVSIADAFHAVEQDSAPRATTARSAASLGTVTPPPEPPGSPTVLSGDEGGPDRQDVPAPESSSNGATPGQTSAGADLSAANVVSDAQRRRLWAMISSMGIEQDVVREVVSEITGDESTKTIPRDLYDAVYVTLQSKAPPAQEIQP